MKKILLLLLVLIQCTTAVEYPVPATTTAATPKVNTSIHAVWERVHQSETGFVFFEREEEPLWLEAYVLSSDASGNFYKELFLQDKPENPTQGLRLLLDQTSLHALYQPGMKIYLKLNGLGAGIENGVLSLGSYEADGVATLARPLIENHVQRSEEVFELVPLKLRMQDLSLATRGLLVQLDAVQFAKSELGKTFSGEAFDTFDGERWIVSCANFRSLSLSSSTFSKFKSVLVDSLSGSIRGIHSRDYYNEKDLLKINHPEAIDFQQTRCDPFFEESFETHPLGRFESEGWLNWIEQGSVYWSVYEDENSLGQSLSMGSYRSKDAASLCWLITPALDLSSLSNPFFSFRSSTAFADQSKLEVFYSIDFRGDPSQIKTATWVALEGTIATESDEDHMWVDSGNLKIQSTSNQVYFAFRYTGSGKTTQDGTYELDDIRLFEGIQ